MAKLIPLRELPALKTTDVIRAVIERPPQGAGLSLLRAGVRLLDAVEKASGDSLILEDADHAVLVAAVNGFTFGMVSKDLLSIVDDILQAKAPPATP